MTTAVETRKLVAHEKLLIDVIKRQAGSLQKAILEGTMNSVEAGATGVSINFLCERTGPAFLSIYDDGIGIKTKKELVNHFETFGQPHEESENVIWKQFRMGRGQMFAFGKNTWRTSQFQMVVDVDNTELDYFLQENLEEKDGCEIEIELYKNPIEQYNISSVKSLQEQVKEQIRFVKIPVSFNDEVLSINPKDLDWDYEDDNAYYLFNDTSRLKIYNLGVYVKSKWINEVGVGGIVVSKKRLKVNFARNDIQSDCNTYKEICEIVQENKIKKAKKTYKTMNDGQRISLLTDFRDGVESFAELKGKRIFKTSQGKWISWSMLTKKYDGPWVFAPVGSRSADKAMEMGVALCLDDSIPEELGYTGEVEKFFDWLMYEQMKVEKGVSPYDQNISYWQREVVEKALNNLRKNCLLFDGSEDTKIIDAKKLQDMFNEDYKPIPHKELRKSEKDFIRVMESFNCWDGRSIRVGNSSVASAWTDGETYITFDRSFLKKIIFTSEAYLLSLFHVACHELAHNEKTTGTHYHGQDFYETYYELTGKVYHKNPFYYVTQFAKKMKSLRIEDKRAKEEQKEQEAKEKLGIAASVK